MNDWHLRPAYEGAETRVFVIEQRVLAPTTEGAVCHLVATLAPQAVIIAQGGATAAFDLAGAPIDTADLAHQFEGIATEVERALG